MSNFNYRLISLESLDLQAALKNILCDPFFVLGIFQRSGGVFLLVDDAFLRRIFFGSQIKPASKNRRSMHWLLCNFFQASRLNVYSYFFCKIVDQTPASTFLKSSKTFSKNVGINRLISFRINNLSWEFFKRQWPGRAILKT